MPGDKVEEGKREGAVLYRLGAESALNSLGIDGGAITPISGLTLMPPLNVVPEIGGGGKEHGGGG